MLGTLTLHGVQIKDIFVADNGMEFKIANSWVPPIMQAERYVLLKKDKDDYWYAIRILDIDIKRV